MKLIAPHYLPHKRNIKCFFTAFQSADNPLIKTVIHMASPETLLSEAIHRLRGAGKHQVNTPGN